METPNNMKKWRLRYYSSVKGAKKWSDKKCFKHILKKYEGALPKVLEEFSAKIDGSDLVFEVGVPQAFHFLGRTCSLCAKYWSRKKADSSGEGCEGCPIFESGKGCGKYEKNTPYAAFTGGNAKPMVGLMNKLLSECNSRGKWVNPKG